MYAREENLLEELENANEIAKHIADYSIFDLESDDEEDVEDSDEEHNNNHLANALLDNSIQNQIIDMKPIPRYDSPGSLNCILCTVVYIDRNKQCQHSRKLRLHLKTVNVIGDEELLGLVEHCKSWNQQQYAICQLLLGSCTTFQDMVIKRGSGFPVYSYKQVDVSQLVNVELQPNCLLNDIVVVMKEELPKHIREFQKSRRNKTKFLRKRLV